MTTRPTIRHAVTIRRALTTLRALTIRRAVAALGALAVLGVTTVIGYWVITGGQWYVVRTPSMGTTAPVGSLLWVRPEPIENVRVGDVITFRPPGDASTYSHRVVAVGAPGRLSTKGDINGTRDPWVVTADELRGKVIVAWPGVGWLVRAAPLLAGGGLLLWLLVGRFTAPRWRAPTALVGASALVSLAIATLRPLVGARLISFVPSPAGADATYVVTGLLPLRISGPGTSLLLHTGEVGTVHLTRPGADGRFRAHAHPDVPWQWWVLAAALCLAPVVWSLLAATSDARQVRRVRGGSRARPAVPRGRRGRHSVAGSRAAGPGWAIVSPHRLRTR